MLFTSPDPMQCVCKLFRSCVNTNMFQYGTALGGEQWQCHAINVIEPPCIRRLRRRLCIEDKGDCTFVFLLRKHHTVLSVDDLSELLYDDSDNANSVNSKRQFFNVFFLLQHVCSTPSAKNTKIKVSLITKNVHKYILCEVFKANSQRWHHTTIENIPFRIGFRRCDVSRNQKKRSRKIICKKVVWTWQRYRQIQHHCLHQLQIVQNYVPAAPVAVLVQHHSMQRIICPHQTSHRWWPPVSHDKSQI